MHLSQNLHKLTFLSFVEGRKDTNFAFCKMLLMNFGAFIRHILISIYSNYSSRFDRDLLRNITGSRIIMAS